MSPSISDVYTDVLDVPEKPEVTMTSVNIVNLKGLKRRRLILDGMCQRIPEMVNNKFFFLLQRAGCRKVSGQVISPLHAENQSLCEKWLHELFLV